VGDTGAGPGEAADAATAAAIRRARAAFLDDRHLYGCAETAFIALKSRFALPDPDDSAAAMALNGGIAWTGGPCGAVTGAALAIGLLTARRIPDQGRAKQVARELVADLMADFAARYRSLDCRDLVGWDLREPGAHAAFIADGGWRSSCMGQIEWVVGSVARLADEAAWEAAVTAIEDDRP
jgi:C_GCAxxG_C_C family probable redox protein